MTEKEKQVLGQILEELKRIRECFEVVTEDATMVSEELYAEAEKVVNKYGVCSVAILQKNLGVGYSKSARLIDMLEERGVIKYKDQDGKYGDVLTKQAETVLRTIEDTFKVRARRAPKSRKKK